MSTQNVRPLGPDADLALEVLEDSGAAEKIVEKTARLLLRAATKVRDWLATEVHTPENSSAPTVRFPEQGPWNGVVVVEADQPAYWALVKAGPGRVAQQTSEPASQPSNGYYAPRYADQPGLGQQQQWPRRSVDEFGDDPFLQDPIWRRP